MAGSSHAPVVVAGQVPLLYLDANILVPEYLRCVFLDLAYAGIVRVHWSRRVLDEVRRNLIKPRFGLPAGDADRLLSTMGDAFPAAQVVGEERFESRFMRLTDAGDAHVAAGALTLSLAGRDAQPVVLVTNNVRHLPQRAFQGTAIRVVRPDKLLTELIGIDPTVAEVLAQMLERFDAPPLQRKDLLDILDRAGCHAFAAALGTAWGLVHRA